MDTICGNSKRLNLERSPLTTTFRTYFEGDPAEGLEPDTEAKELWLAAGMAEDHIVPGNLKVRLRRLYIPCPVFKCYFCLVLSFSECHSTSFEMEMPRKGVNALIPPTTSVQISC